MALKYTERNTKQDVQAVQQQYVPHAKERLRYIPKMIRKITPKKNKKTKNNAPRRGDSR